MKKTSDREILKDIFINYVFKIPQIRILILPTALTMIISRFMEVKVSEITQKVSILFIEENEEHRFYLVCMYFLVALSSCLLIELQGFIFTGSVQRAFRVACKDTFKYFISLDYNKYHNIGSGEIQSVINRKSKAVSEIIDVLAINFLPTVLVILLTNIKIFYALGTVPTIIINVTLLIYSVITINISIYRNKIRTKLNSATDKSSNTLYDSLSNYDTVVAFNNEVLECERFDDTLKEVERHSNTLWRSFYFLNFLQRVTFSMQTASIILFGAYGWFMERMKPDVFIMYLTVTRILASNLDKLGYMYSRYGSAITNARLTHYIGSKTNLKVLENYLTFKEKITFSNVGLYRGSKVIFKNVNLEIKKGEKIAIVGRNGAGKSSLLKILLKYNNYEGIVKIEEEDLINQSSITLRNLISYVGQDAPLFNDTVRYNIKYSNLDCPDYFMIDLSKKIGLHESIMRLRDGYNTVVGERGKFLSGGERQKVALLRALLKDSEIFLFDEPTAAFDKEAEYDVLNNLFGYAKSKTVIMVVHNFDLLKLFDKIFCFSNGSVKEICKVEELYNEKDLVIW